MPTGTLREELEGTAELMVADVAFKDAEELLTEEEDEVGTI